MAWSLIFNTDKETIQEVRKRYWWMKDEKG